MADVYNMVLDCWESLEDVGTWSFCITMPFPLRWDGSPTPIVWYAYADRQSPTLVDAIELSHPWAIVELERDREGPAAPTLFLISKQPILLGPQGVRPLSSDRVPQKIEGRPPTWSILSSGCGDDALKESVRIWKRFHGAMFNAIAPRHPDFIRWVNS